jgi:hypothetical protein
MSAAEPSVLRPGLMPTRKSPRAAVPNGGLSTEREVQPPP